jgi:uncharacterized protein (DUF58 family)
MIDSSFLQQLDRFNLIINKRVTSSYLGERKSVAAGQGVMFKDYRIYAPGDDIRTIDWKVFARTDDLYVKTFEEERNLSIHIMVDSSASMNFGKSITKFDYAAMVGVGFAYLALKNNEKFQFSTFAEELEFFQAKRGMSQLLAMIDHLNTRKPQGQSQLGEILKKYKKSIGSKALVFLISDFLMPVDEIKEALYVIANHNVNIIHILDPEERELHMEGDIKLKDMETGEKMDLHMSRRLETQYQDMLEHHMAAIKDVGTSLGMKYFPFITNVTLFDTFYQILG